VAAASPQVDDLLARIGPRSGADVALADVSRRAVRKRRRTLQHFLKSARPPVGRVGGAGGRAAVVVTHAPDGAETIEVKGGAFDVAAGATMMDYLRVAPPCMLKLWLPVLMNKRHLKFKERQAAWQSAIEVVDARLVLTFQRFVMAAGRSETRGDQARLIKQQREGGTSWSPGCAKMATSGHCIFSRGVSGAVADIEDMFATLDDFATKGPASGFRTDDRKGAVAPLWETAARAWVADPPDAAAHATPTMLCTRCTLGDFAGRPHSHPRALRRAVEKRHQLLSLG
jgi:hypothetical protein